MDKKEIMIISIHSFVDVITNSSTELFVCDTDKTVEMVRVMVDGIQTRYPNEYGHWLSVTEMDPDDYMISEIFDVYGNNDEDMVKYLRAKGYKIEEPDKDHKPVSKYIQIAAERGGMDPRVKKFIEENFNVIHYTTEA